MITTYKTITTPTQAEFKDKGSRFIAYAYPIRTLADVKKYLDPLKEEHHKSTTLVLRLPIGCGWNAVSRK